MKNRRRFRDQNYEKIRQSCLKTEHPFVDTTFPPNNTSLFLEQGRSSDIEWKRPKDLHDDPHLFVEGASANDVTQGILGNCWFVSACSALTHNQDLLDMVIPNAEDQEWSADKGYAGIFRFRFWRFGEWVEVVIDDLLPTRNGKLLFARSKTPNEFWSALLEKAFAKLYGCYENLVGGHLSDALQDVSGGVAQTINVGKYLKSDQTRLALELFSHLSESFNSRALIVAAIAAKTKEEIEQTLDCGLVKGHAYAVTAIRSVELANKTSNSITNYLFGSNDCQKLIRLQNPWGEKEWNGSWSDNSPEWEQVGEKEKASLGITVDEDGEFWMSWESFIQYFTDISVCQLMNTGLFSMSKIYHEEILVSEWTTNGVKSGAPNDLAGGCLNFSATFCNNPQYLFHVSEPESDIMFALTQRDQSEGEKRRDPYVTIGMHVMRVESNRKHRLHQPMVAVGTSDYANARSAFLELRDLPVGNYVVLPTTFAPREQAQFMLRIYADHRINVKTLKKHSPSFGICGCKNATSVIRIKVHDFECSSVLNMYCILKNKKSLVRTATIKQSSHPKFEDQFVFHSSKVSDSFVIEVWEDRLLEKDRLIAFSSFPVAIDNDNRDLELDLKSGSEREAKVRLSISAFDDPMYL